MTWIRTALDRASGTSSLTICSQQVQGEAPPPPKQKKKK